MNSLEYEVKEDDPEIDQEKLNEFLDKIFSNDSDEQKDNMNTLIDDHMRRKTSNNEEGEENDD